MLPYCCREGWQAMVFYVFVYRNGINTLSKLEEGLQSSSGVHIPYTGSRDYPDTGHHGTKTEYITEMINKILKKKKKDYWKQAVIK